MTHFPVGIIVPTDNLPAIHDFIAVQMAPYDENTEVRPYVSYSVEKAKAELERDIRRLEQIIRQQDPEYNLEKCRDLLATLRKTTPVQRYAEYLQHHELFDAQGKPLSTYNLDSKWDWWVIGGRWDGWINGKATSGETVVDNMATTRQAIERGVIPHAVITPDGHWHERGQMGWWAILITENEDWDAQAREILSGYPGHQFLILDAHI